MRHVIRNGEVTEVPDERSQVPKSDKVAFIAATIFGLAVVFGIIIMFIRSFLDYPGTLSP